MVQQQEKQDRARESRKRDEMARERPIRAIDLEGDSPLVRFDQVGDAAAYVEAQNRTQGRTRWCVLAEADVIPDRTDGTPALLPMGRQTSLAGEIVMGPALTMEVAAAIANASTGTRRIVDRMIATPVDGKVSLEIQGVDREWNFDARDGRRLAARMATLGIAALSITGE